MADFVPAPAADLLDGLEVSTDPARSTIPLTLGSRRKPYDEVYSIMFKYTKVGKVLVLGIMHLGLGYCQLLIFDKIFSWYSVGFYP